MIVSTVLTSIVQGVREDLSARQASTPLADVQQQTASVPSARNPWAPESGQDSLGVIAEVKRRSPSKGHLADIPVPAELASEYAAGGATAISVLTEERRFGGSLADFDAVRAAVDVPLLRKDFLVTEYQIWEARAHGADLALLIVAALDDAQLNDLTALTRELGMCPLIEVHSEWELDRALAVGADVIGINARDLHTLDVDPGTVTRLLPRIPSEIIAVAESGIASTAGATEYAQAGADAVLVGQALVTGDQPREQVRQFRSIARHGRPTTVSSA